MFVNCVLLSSQTPEWVNALYDQDWITERGGAGLTAYRTGKPVSGYKKDWSLLFKDEFFSNPVLKGNNLYFAGDSGTVYCVSRSGKTVWIKSTDDSFEASALVLQNQLIIGGLSGTLWAMDPLTGKVLWKYEAEGRITAGANFFKKNGTEFVCFGTYSGNFYCLDAADGRLIWQAKADSFINGTPVVTAIGLAFGSCDGEIRFFTLDGQMVWELATGSYVPESIAADNQYIYAAQYEGKLLKIDQTNGEVQWTAFSTDEAPFFTSPAVSQDYVVCAAKDGLVYVFSAKNGKLARSLEIPDQLSGSPILYGKQVILVSSNGRLLTIDPSSSLDPMVTLTGVKPAGGLIASKDKIYFTTSKGEIQAWSIL